MHTLLTSMAVLGSQLDPYFDVAQQSFAHFDVYHGNRLLIFGNEFNANESSSYLFARDDSLTAISMCAGYVGQVGNSNSRT